MAIYKPKDHYAIVGRKPAEVTLPKNVRAAANALATTIPAKQKQVAQKIANYSKQMLGTRADLAATARMKAEEGRTALKRLGIHKKEALVEGAILKTKLAQNVVDNKELGVKQAAIEQTVEGTKVTKKAAQTEAELIASLLQEDAKAKSEKIRQRKAAEGIPMPPAPPAAPIVITTPAAPEPKQAPAPPVAAPTVPPTTPQDTPVQIKTLEELQEYLPTLEELKNKLNLIIKEEALLSTASTKSPLSIEQARRNEELKHERAEIKRQIVIVKAETDVTKHYYDVLQKQVSVLEKSTALQKKVGGFDKQVDETLSIIDKYIEQRGDKLNDKEDAAAIALQHALTQINEVTTAYAEGRGNELDEIDLEEFQENFEQSVKLLEKIKEGKVKTQKVDGDLDLQRLFNRKMKGTLLDQKTFEEYEKEQVSIFQKIGYTVRDIYNEQKKDRDNKFNILRLAGSAFLGPFGLFAAEMLDQLDEATGIFEKMSKYTAKFLPGIKKSLDDGNKQEKKSLLGKSSDWFKSLFNKGKAAVGQSVAAPTLTPSTVADETQSVTGAPTPPVQPQAAAPATSQPTAVTPTPSAPPAAVVQSPTATSTPTASPTPAAQANSVPVGLYSRKQLEDETGEYFENEHTSQQFPNLFKDKEHMVQVMQEAPVTTLSKEDLDQLQNSDVGDVQNAEDPKAFARELAKEYGRDIEALLAGIEQGKEIPPPIVLKSKEKGLSLLSGNTRLMAAAASGKQQPVKVIDTDKVYAGQPQRGEATPQASVKAVQQPVTPETEVKVVEALAKSIPPQSSHTQAEIESPTHTASLAANLVPTKGENLKRSLEDSPWHKKVLKLLNRIVDAVERKREGKEGEGENIVDDALEYMGIKKLGGMAKKGISKGVSATKSIAQKGARALGRVPGVAKVVQKAGSLKQGAAKVISKGAPAIAKGAGAVARGAGGLLKGGLGLAARVLPMLGGLVAGAGGLISSGIGALGGLLGSGAAALGSVAAPAAGVAAAGAGGYLAGKYVINPMLDKGAQALSGNKEGTVGTALADAFQKDDLNKPVSKDDIEQLRAERAAKASGTAPPVRPTPESVQPELPVKSQQAILESGLPAAQASGKDAQTKDLDTVKKKVEIGSGDSEKKVSLDQRDVNKIEIDIQDDEKKKSWLSDIKAVTKQAYAEAAPAPITSPAQRTAIEEQQQAATEARGRLSQTPLGRMGIQGATALGVGTGVAVASGQNVVQTTKDVGAVGKQAYVEKAPPRDITSQGDLRAYEQQKAAADEAKERLQQTGVGKMLSGGAEAVGGTAGKATSLIKGSMENWDKHGQNLTDAATRYGVDPSQMAKTAYVESAGFKNNAKAGTSSASGLMQFLDGTFVDTVAKHGAENPETEKLAEMAAYAKSTYGGRGGFNKEAARADPKLKDLFAAKEDSKVGSLMGAAYTADNIKKLEKAGVTNANDAEVYSAHFTGNTKLAATARSTPDMSMQDMLKSGVISQKQIDANKSVFEGKKTAGEVMQELNRRVSQGQTFGDKANVLAGKATGTAVASSAMPAALATNTAPDNYNKPGVGIATARYEPVEYNRVASERSGSGVDMSPVRDAMTQQQQPQQTAMQPIPIGGGGSGSTGSIPMFIDNFGLVLINSTGLTA